MKDKVAKRVINHATPFLNKNRFLESNCLFRESSFRPSSDASKFLRSL